MKITALLLVLAFAGTATAGDHWDDCSSADGNVRLSNGMLTVGDLQEEITYSGEGKVLATIEDVKNTCILKDSGQEVLVYANTITVEQITYALEEDGPAAAMTETVLCQRGAGMLVPEDMCKEGK